MWSAVSVCDAAAFGDWAVNEAKRRHPGSFIPIILEQLVRERGVLLSDKSRSCKPNLEHPASVNVSTEYLRLKPRVPHSDRNQCVFQFLGWDMNTASFAMYTFSFSVLLQALLIISMSGAADHGRYRKLLLLAFAVTGAMATMLFVVAVPEIYILGSFLAIVSNTCFGASFVLLNSFLPLLVRNHPDIRHRDNADNEDSSTRHERLQDEGEEVEEHHLESSTDALLSSTKTGLTAKANGPGSVSAELVLSTKISSYGIGIGYTAAVIVQSLAIGILLVTKWLSRSSTLGLRLVLFFVGSWSVIFGASIALSWIFQEA